MNRFDKGRFVPRSRINENNAPALNILNDLSIQAKERSEERNA